MAKSKKSSLGRRRFLKGAAAGAAAFVANPQGGQAQHGQEHDHDHDHQAVPSDLTLRVKALESLLVEKDWSIELHSMRSSTRTSIKSARISVPALSHARGWMRNISAVS